MTKSALLLVDIQYDFISGSLAVPGAEEILAPTYSLLDNHKWDLVIASQDHHPPGHISFASRHGVEPFTTRTVQVPGSSETKQQEMWPDHCVHGTRGAEIEDGVRERIDKLGGVVVKKGEDTEVDAYSAFETRCTGSHADQSQVAKLLADHQITSLYVVGLATDFCVRASVLAALQAADHADLHWTTTVIREGCRGVDANKSRETLDELNLAGARVVSIEDEEVRSLGRE